MLVVVESMSSDLFMLKNIFSNLYEPLVYHIICSVDTEVIQCEDPNVSHAKMVGIYALVKKYTAGLPLRLGSTTVLFICGDRYKF